MILQIKDILKKYVDQNLDIPRLSEEIKIASAWGKLGALHPLDQARPEKLVGGTLYLRVRDSAWAQQIHLMMPEILSKLNEELGERAVMDIRLKTGFVTEKNMEEKAEPCTAICGRCSATFPGAGDLCPICSREKSQRDYRKLYRMIDKDPKLTLSAARGEVPGIREVDYRRTKRDVNARKREQQEQKRNYYGKGKTKTN